MPIKGDHGFDNARRFNGLGEFVGEEVLRFLNWFPFPHSTKETLVILGRACCLQPIFSLLRRPCFLISTEDGDGGWASMFSMVAVQVEFFSLPNKQTARRS